jgi:VWFA-related protein
MQQNEQLGIRSNEKVSRQGPEAEVVFRIVGLRWKIVYLGLICLAALTATAQQPPQDIPDAPSASQPPQNFPKAAPNPKAGTTPGPNSDTGPVPDSQPQPRSNAESSTPPAITPVPAGRATPGGSSGNEQLYTLTRNVNQVLVPVMVKDNSGRLVSGLLPTDFAVYEDGKKQALNFFTADPFALSAAVIFDLGMSDIAVQKVIQTLPALEGAFSQFDEISIYTYSSSVSKMTDFAATGRRLEAALNELKTVRGRNNGPPVTSGPMGPQGPTINGRPLDPSTPIVITPAKESHVLNDALVAATLDLSKRDRTRRKVIFIISEGREYRSNASYSDTLKLLLSHGVMVYAAAVESAAIPVYGKLQRLHLPKLGYSDILPKYASATGGEVFNGFSREAIESIYARALGDARNQYTLGYMTRATPSSAHREIEVKVARPDLAVTAKEGYYPVGLAR